MTPSTTLPPLVELTREIVRLLPEYLPGVATGTVAPTEGRTCWVHSWEALLTAIGHEHHMDVVAREEGDSALIRQLTLYWKRGDGIMTAFLTGWGDREELDRRFQTLETIKAPQKVIVYSCAKWQDAVLEQLGAALLRYPHHIEGEQYLALNLLGMNHTLAAHTISILRSGELRLADLERFRPLHGSPFPWGQPIGEDH